MFQHLLTCVYICFTRSVRLLAIKPNKNVSAYVLRTYYAISCFENCEKTMQKCTIHINHVHLYMYVSYMSVSSFYIIVWYLLLYRQLLYLHVCK